MVQLFDSESIIFITSNNMIMIPDSVNDDGITYYIILIPAWREQQIVGRVQRSSHSVHSALLVL